MSPTIGRVTIPLEWLDPRTCVAPWEGMTCSLTEASGTRSAMGVSFLTPHLAEYGDVRVEVSDRTQVYFANPIDGGPPATGCPLVRVCITDPWQWAGLSVEDVIEAGGRRWVLTAGRLIWVAAEKGSV